MNEDQQQKESGKKRLIFIISIGVIILLIIAFVLYYFLWRPTDNDYKDTSSDLTKMSLISNNVDTVIGKLTSATQISDTLVSQLRTVVTSYEYGVINLSRNAIISRDFTVKAAYHQNADTILNYGVSVASLANGLQKYRTLLTQCTIFVQTISHTSSSKSYVASSSYTSSSKSCNAAINDAKASKSTAFNNQYLSDYIGDSSSLLNAYEQLVSAGTNVTAQNKAINTIRLVKVNILALNQKKLSLTPEPNPKTALQKLTAVVNSQAKSLFR
jgi:hypothetical protein